MRMMKNNEIRKYLVTAVMAAVIAVLSPFSVTIPISPVPISLATLGIYFSAYILGAKYSAISVVIYVLLGIIGLPIFTGFTGGIGKIMGPTGGYIISYVFLAIIAGTIIEKNYENIIICFLGMFVGTIILYIVGTLWLAFVTNMTFEAALLAGVVPFIPGDVVKMLMACMVGSKVRVSLIKTNYL